MTPDDFWHRCSSVCSRIGQPHREQQVNVTQIGLEQTRNLFVCPQLSARQMSPHFIGRRLAGPRYQLVQTGIVENGRHQEDPVVR